MVTSDFELKFFNGFGFKAHFLHFFINFWEKLRNLLIFIEIYLFHMKQSQKTTQNHFSFYLMKIFYKVKKYFFGQIDQNYPPYFSQFYVFIISF